MPTVLDYMFNADAAQAKNRLMDQQAQLAPINSMITAQNAATKQGQLQQSKSRFNDAYAFNKILATLPPAAKANFVSQPDVADYISKLAHQYGAAAVANSTGLGVDQINKIAGISTSQTTTNLGSLQSAIQSPTQNNNSAAQNIQPSSQSSGANSIVQGAQNDYVKHTTDNSERDFARFGKNLETTFSQADPYIPSVAKYAGFEGKAKLKIDKGLAALGVKNPDYENYNNFMNEIGEQLTRQIRQFGKSSIQPTDVERIRDRLAPRIDEDSQMYINRYNLMKQNLVPELKQMMQSYNETMKTPPIDLSSQQKPAGTLQQPAPDFSSLLANRGVK